MSYTVGLKLAQVSQGQGQGQEKEGRRQRLMEQTTLQHWLRRSSAVDTVRVQRVPSQSFEAWTAVSFFHDFFFSLTPASRCAAGCPAGVLLVLLSYFSPVSRIIASTGINNNIMFTRTAIDASETSVTLAPRGFRCHSRLETCTLPPPMRYTQTHTHTQ